MDKIKLLQARRSQLMDASKTIREEINRIIDKESFVELSAYSFSENEFYGDKAEGEGVVTGFATINGFPFYIVAQNAAVFNGGVSKANCEKIAKCLDMAEKNDAPVVYLLSSLGVRIGEGVNALEGMASLMLKSAQLKGTVPQYLVVNGEVYGQLAVLAATCDFTFFINKKSVLSVNSPLVLAASSDKNADKFAVGGAQALCKAQLASVAVESLEEVRNTIVKLSDVLYNPVVDCDNLNASLTALNKKCGAKELINVFDKDTAIELGSGFEKEVKCVLGRVGGIAVAAVIFDNADGVYIDAAKMRKVKDFAEFACCHNLPFVTFVNTLGINPTMDVNDSPVLKEIAEYINILDCTDNKISVIYGKAVGLGYTVFAAKSMGYDYSYAFATAKIALFDSVQGAEIEFAEDKKADKSKLAERYADENSDPINAAKGGYIDNVIEPSFVRQYLIASLQMLAK